MQIGDYRIEIIPDSEFRLDGGAMFGVVPRVLWERLCPPDDKNRIRLNMNCVFIETPDERILIETGIGEKWTARETAIYGIRRAKPLAESLFEITGFRPDDITIVVNTHLHFDHAGGNTVWSEPGEVATGFERKASDTGGTPAPLSVPQFRNARYLVSTSEFQHAENPYERDRASYLPENWRPLHEAGKIELMPDSYDVVPGLKMQTERGHSKTMQTWRLDSGGKTMYGFADLVPTRHHLSPAWIAGYDLYPVETLEFKNRILPQAANEKWLCLFYHDFEHPLCRISEFNGKLVAEPYEN